MTPMPRVSARLEHRLHKAVLRAAARITDPGLAARVAHTEHTLWDGRRREHAANLAQLLACPWRDEHGLLHCPTCGGLAENRTGTGIPLCACPTKKGPTS